MKVRTNLLKDVKNHYLRELEKVYGKKEALSLLNIIIEDFFGLTKTGQILEKDFRLNETELLKIHFAVKELKKEKPVQYITGKAEFYGLNLKVNENVLIPRPETEELIENIKNELSSSAIKKIIDLGTGSGCIALALKKVFPQADVTAVDISENALKIAMENAAINNLKIRFEQKDMLNTDELNSLETFDLIVSNPPYVTEADKDKMQNNVLKYEPHAALFVDDNNPLIFYKSISEFAKSNLNTGGQIWFEINEKYGNDVKGLLEEKGFKNVNIVKDLFGKDRFVKGKR